MSNLYPENLNTHKKDWGNTTPVKDTHPEEHNDIAAAVEALEAKVGANSSAVQTSHDYKLSEITGDDKAASKEATETALAEHIEDTENPHEVTKAQVGLSNVDNTSDATKNVAMAILENKTIDAEDNLIENLDTDNFAPDVVDDDGSMFADSADRIPTQRAVKEYVDANAGGDGLDRQVFTASGTWNKPANGDVAFVQVWGGGGSGGRRGGSGGGAGGGGGSYIEAWLPLSSLPSSVAVTVGAGGAGRTGNFEAGAAGGSSSFGAYLTANGGSGGQHDGTSGAGGAGGSTDSAGGFAGGTAGAPNGGTSVYGGGGGGRGSNPAGTGGSSIYGGGGGGGGHSSSGAAGGASGAGGAGGAGGNGAVSGTAGATPGGGGGGTSTGATSGAGGGGMVIVTVF
jgi:hypothetical protein